MSYNRSNEIDEDQIVSFLENALRRVETDSDPDTLNKLKKLYKKTIPFSRRMYVAAFLTNQAASRGGRFGRGNDRRFDRGERDSRFTRDGRTERDNRFDRNDRADHGRTERQSRDYGRQNDRADSPERQQQAPLPRVQIDPALATTIFIGIGRNRRVFPRDLVGLLVSVAGLDRERIGEIRVLANYSFIQLFTEDCEKAISALDGYDYRGRKLSVSYSRQKDDSSACASETASASAAEGERESIPSSVTNESHGIAPEASESAKIAAEQTAFAAQQVSYSSAGETSTQAPYSETTDDGQVKSHFGNGDAY